jgi:hypothetical protein
MYTRSIRSAGATLACAVLLGGAASESGVWGLDGHFMVGRAAATALPSEMPAFFRSAVDRLEYLNYEPDRWRDRDLREMDQAFQYDHYIDLENVPPRGREAADRFEYLTVLFRETSLEVPQRDGGFLPFRILELHQRLVTGFRRWRAVTDPGERAWIEERILNDAGTIGHYVADGAQPHHTTIHFNGWSPNASNPRGFTIERDFHSRFESGFVSAGVRIGDLAPYMQPEPRRLVEVRAEVWSYLLDTHGEVVRLYELEQEYGFDPERPAAQTRAFAAERLAAGADMLRSLWWSAWLESADEAG